MSQSHTQWNIEGNISHMINPHTVVKKLHPNPVLWVPHVPRGLFQVKRHFDCTENKVLSVKYSDDFRRCGVRADPAQLDEG